MMFICFPTAYYTGLMIRYLPVTGILLYISFAISGIFIAGIALMTYHYIKSDHWNFGEFKSFFAENKFSQIYWIAHIIQRLILGLVFGILATSYIPNFILIVIMASHSAFVYYKKPYSLKE